MTSTRPPAGSPDERPARTGSRWHRLVELARPRATRGQTVVAVLCLLLGVALVTSVHTHRAPRALRTAREEDLVRLLDGLSARSDRLRQQIARLEAERAAMSASGDQERAALEEARREVDALAVLTGTARATGPGVVLSISDPDGRVSADTMLDVVQELRDAGAEAIEIGRLDRAVRVVAATYFLDGEPGSVVVDGTEVRAPYRVVAIGDPPTLAAAMRIPGGVVDSVQREGGDVEIEPSQRVDVAALRPLDTPRYARPAPDSSGSTGPTGTPGR